ncbi:YeeE/YedE thiosulfate transporter family protein [Sphingomonas sp.]|uniref:YeeE/YedE thiosulfate transporter family protein n=1 Tax=Sphingomonas sp. TaxID=28214 RepID=UPI001B0BDEA0|nr:YeeE/YedE thiosulfate transporter family protein [Sphingomonas sp.]MBO9711698.1 YeeE/YedE family protein [Sphingomonas sp.]
MAVVIASAGFALALLCAVTMGYGVQRGATCAVSAVDEIVNRRRAAKLAAIAEAALWVAGLLLLLRALGVTMAAPKGYALGAWTILGGMLLGFGAWVNRACVFGTVARVGSGEWVYLLTPLGFIAGCFAMAPVVHWIAPARAPVAPPLLAAPELLLLPFAALMLWRLWEAGHAMRRRDFARHIWSPHRATVVIGIAFVAMLLTVGAWAYTDALAELVLGGMGATAVRLILLAGLFGGSILAGQTNGAGMTRPTMRGAIRCFAGGMLLGAGGVLVPGSNDGLLLLGMPLLQPYAWAAFAAMTATIGAALLVSRRLA